MRRCSTPASAARSRCAARDCPRSCTSVPSRTRVDDATLLAVSPGVGVDDPIVAAARCAGVDVAGDIELFARATGDAVPVHGVTGTNGKSTVARLLGDMLTRPWSRRRRRRRPRRAGLELLAGAAHGYVLELSSFQLELVGAADCWPAPRAQPVAGSSRPARHHRALRGLEAADLPGREDIACTTATPRAARRRRISPAPQVARADRTPRPVSGASPTPMTRSNCRADRRRILRRAADRRPPQRLQRARGAGPRRAPRGVAPRRGAAVAAYVPLPHRCMPVAASTGRAFVDDSKATNVGACRAALEAWETAGGAGSCSRRRPRQGRGLRRAARRRRRVTCGRSC